MSKTHRHFLDDSSPIEVDVDSGVTIEEGDFVCIASAADAAAEAGVAAGVTEGNLIPAELVTGKDAATRKANAQLQLAGIALSSSDVGETKKVLVGRRGRYQLTQLAAAAAKIGSNLEIDFLTSKLQNQVVEAGDVSPIAVVCEKKGATGTSVMAELKCQYWNNTTINTTVESPESA